MFDILISEQFRRDLDSLDKVVREQRIPETIDWIRNNPHHPGLRSERQTSIHGRTIWRSRVTQKYRLLWEYRPNGVIGLWRVGNHEFIDSFRELPGVEEIGWEEHPAQSSPAGGMASALQSINFGKDEALPLFRRFHDNHLRLFGVPDSLLDEVRALHDPEQIWDLLLPESVKYTLYDIVMQEPDQAAFALLNPEQFLYCTTADQLEGYCKGRIKRLLLNLTPEQEALVKINATGALLIKGVAGSGKTTIGLYRAHHLMTLIEQQRRLFGENASILVLTYTRTLATALKQLFIELHGAVPEKIIVDTFDHWMLDLLYPNTNDYPVAKEAQRKQLVEKAMRQVAAGSSLSSAFFKSYDVDFLLAEIDEVIRGRGLMSLEAYQNVERVGRGQALDRERHRPIVWRVYAHYQQLLDQAGLVDFADLPRQVLKRCNPLPRYEAVIIDEAQDFPPVRLRLAAKLTSEYTESRGLTLLADPAQSIYYRGISWKEGGVDIRGGRTRTLAKNFRNTQQILEAAKSILDGCEDLKAEDEYILPSSTSKRGPKPILVQYDELSEAEQVILAIILRLCQLGRYRPGDFAVLARWNEPALNQLKKLLPKQGIPACHYKDENFSILENQVKLLTMHSAKGLEFPVVFLTDLSDRRIAPSGSTENEEDTLNLERKLFYVSMTRASERLYLLHPKHNRNCFLRDLDPNTFKQSSAKELLGWQSFITRQ